MTEDREQRGRVKTKNREDRGQKAKTRGLRGREKTKSRKDKGQRT